MDFETYVQRTAAYVAAIREAGDSPWFECPVKLAKLEAQMPGIEELSPLERRRALWTRHRKEQP
jgi:hypothetical protein